MIIFSIFLYFLIYCMLAVASSDLLVLFKLSDSDSAALNNIRLTLRAVLGELFRNVRIQHVQVYNGAEGRRGRGLQNLP